VKYLGECYTQVVHSHSFPLCFDGAQRRGPATSATEISVLGTLVLDTIELQMKHSVSVDPLRNVCMYVCMYVCMNNNSFCFPDASI
jgi:hypothetical protein